MGSTSQTPSQPETATIPPFATVVDSGVQIVKTPESESIQTLSKGDKDTRLHDPSGADIKVSQHLIKDTKPSNEVADPAHDTKETQQIPDSKDTPPGSNITTNPHPKRKANSDTPENDIVDPPSDESFKARKKAKQWKRKQRKVEKMHQWKQEAGLEDPPS